MKFLGHLELMKLFERTFRFEKMPLKFSEGFNPQPKMTFGSPLSVGYSSQCEVMEVQLTEEVELSDVLKMNFPEGIDLISAQYVKCKTSLMAGVTFARYEIEVNLDGADETLPHKLASFLLEKEMTIEKKNKKGLVKKLNVRDRVHEFKYRGKEDDLYTFECLLTHNSQGSLKPELLIDLFCEFAATKVSNHHLKVNRIGLYTGDLNGLIDLFELKDANRDEPLS